MYKAAIDPSEWKYLSAWPEVESQCYIFEGSTIGPETRLPRGLY